MNMIGCNDMTRELAGGMFSLLDSLTALRGLTGLEVYQHEEKALLQAALDILIQHQDVEHCAAYQVCSDHLQCIGSKDWYEASSTRPALPGGGGEVLGAAFSMGEGPVGRAAQTGDLFHCRDCSVEPRPMGSEAAVPVSGSLICVPLVSRTTILGIVTLRNSRSHAFQAWHEQVFSLFCSVLAHMVVSNRLLRRMENAVARRTIRLSESNARLEQEVAERKKAEEALRASERRYRALYNDKPSMFFTVAADGTILSANRFGATHLRYAVDELVGLPMASLHPRVEAPMVKGNLKKCLENPDAVYRWELRKVRRDGNVLWVRETARMVRDTEGKPTVLLVCEDVTEAHRLSEQLSYQASHDSLTGLVNRRAFEQRLERVIQTAKNNRSNHAVCYLDLDQFKVINDTCGHVAGDDLLRQLGGILQSQVRRRDTLARLGGDEFGVLMKDCSLTQAMGVASALHKTIEDFRFFWQDKTFSIGVSMGLVPIDATSESITEVLSAADSACYAAKDAGRNRVHVYHVEDAELARRQGEMQWVARITRALEEERFHLYFQPIMPIEGRTNQGEHYELLLRMEDESGEFALPGAFLPAAERYNLSGKLDRWVIRTAFHCLTRNPSQLKGLGLCAINLSGQSLGDDEFLRFVVREFDESGIDPKKICFEVTETAAIANLSGATRFIQTLQGKHCRFALDDFGSGLSSFAYLKNLPVHFLKIDGVFVKDIVDDPIDFAMVKSINEIGQVMGKQTIAECVESAAILERLREIGVDYAQGYYVGAPRPITELFGPQDRVEIARAQTG